MKLQIEQKVDLFLSYLLGSKKTAVLTGAGISTGSGIPDYRTPGTGLWERSDMSVVSLEGFLKTPEKYYSYALEMSDLRKNAKPNKAHLLLSRLEKDGYLSGTITQNVDGLHGLAGTENVYELHGSLVESSCLGCGKNYKTDELIKRVDGGDNPPLCVDCGDLIKPKAVFFGEPLPEEPWVKAVDLVKSSDLLFVIGTSLQVYPVNNLPFVATQAGATLIILNLQPTPFDNKAVLIINEDIGLFFDILERKYPKKH